MTNPERLPTATVTRGDGRRNHAHGSGYGALDSFKIELRGRAVWLLAGGVAALLYGLAERLGAG